MKKLFLLVVLAFATGLAVAASAASETAKPAAPHGGMTIKPGASVPPGHSGDIPADNNLINNSKVLDVLETDMYTYLQVTSEKGPQWIAVYKTPVEKGATVRFSNGVMMTKFFSKALNRTFDTIIFVDSLEKVSK
jgi:hypothetical protein